MGLLMMLGLIVIYAIGPQRAHVLNTLTGADLGSNFFFIKQVVSLTAALAAFAFFAYLPFKWVDKYAWHILLAAFGTCLLLAVADFANLGIAQESLGATRWLNLGPISFQPSEALKFGVLVYLASFLGRRVKAGEINDASASLVPVAVIAAISVLFVIFLQKDMGTGLALTAIILGMLYVGGIKLKTMGVIVGGLVLAMVMLILIAPHRMDRVATYLSGDSTSVDDPGGYHITHAKIAIGSGGLLGVGIGNSVQATGYLPEAINDSVFAIMGETFGFVGLVVIIVLFTALLIRLLKVMGWLPDPRMRLMVAGVFAWLGSHIVLNIAAMIGLAPLTGITLPLLSYGGTSMVFIAAALGLAFQVSGYTDHRIGNKEAGNADSNSRRRVRRSRYAGSRGTARA